MRVYFRLLTLIAVGLFALCSQRVGAGPILNDPEQWDSGLAGWTNEVPIGTTNATLSNPVDYLNIAFGQQSGAPTYEQDTVYTTNVNETGTFSNLAVRFTFYAEDILPLYTIVYMHPQGEPNTDFWQYAFTNSGIGAWIQYDIQFVYNAGWVWSAGAGSEAQFLSDLANIDWIGVNIARNLDTMAQDYRLDDWEYYDVTAIPEPGAVCVLVSSLLSMGLIFRKRLKCAVANVA